jgi:hypothetical protein
MAAVNSFIPSLSRGLHLFWYGFTGIIEADERRGLVTTETAPTETRKFFTVFIDGKEYQVEKSELTGAEIMALGGIPQEVGLILVEEDGTQVKVAPADTIELKPGRRFKKAPRFVRGYER